MTVVLLALLAAVNLDQALNEATANSDEVLAKLQSTGESMIRPFISIIFIVVVSFVLLRLLRSVVRGMIARFMEDGSQSRRERTLKANTLANIIESAGKMVIVIVAGMMVLSKLNVNIAPLLASAGVVGIAIGLGAQSLIKDVIGGFFILFEDQFGVGDVVAVGGVSGLVESLSLRRTGLRATDGSFIIVPNGEIRTVTNMTKGWSRAVIDVGVSYDDDIDHVISVLHDIVDNIEQDSIVGDAVIAPAEITGVEALGAYEVMIRILVKTRPTEQWRVQRELRRRIKRIFEEKGITIPYPHNVTLVRSDSNGTNGTSRTQSEDSAVRVPDAQQPHS